MSVSIVIPNYNGAELLLKNLPSVVTASKNRNNDVQEIIIVDDASVDDSTEIIKRNFPEIKLVRHRANRGFSSSVNTGARSSKGEWIALLNTDVKVAEDFLVSSLELIKKRSLFAVSFNERGYSWAKGFFKNGFVGHSPGRKTVKVHDTFWANGGSGLFRRSLWMKLGGMDEKLFSPFYWEDVDLGYRAQKRGYRILWDPNAKVHHEHESTVKKISKKKRNIILERNQLLFIWKNITSPILFRKHVIGLIGRLSSHPGYIIILLTALRRLKVVRKARIKEKRESKVSDEAIFARLAD